MARKAYPGDVTDAERAFLRALQIDGDSAHAHAGIAAVYLRMNKPTLAADHALSAVGLLHHMPVAHFRLARALARLHEYETCAQALEVCLSMRPMFLRGRRLLVRVYQEKLGRADMASKHQQILDMLKPGFL